MRRAFHFSLPPSHPWERRAALHLPGLSCRACARRAEDVLRRVPGVLGATVRLVREHAEVRFDIRAVSEEDLAAAVRWAGYAVGPAAPRASGEALAVDLGIVLAVLGSLVFLARAAVEASIEAARFALATVALAVAGATLAGRAIGLLRRGILTREALAGAAAIACFLAEALPPLLGHGVSSSAWQVARGAGYEAAAAIGAASLVGHAVERALFGGARAEPREGTWEDAAERGLFTAALGCASFAVVTHLWLGRPTRAIFSAAAVLVVVSPAWMRVARTARSAVLGAVFNAVLIPAAALGYLDPIQAAALGLAGALVGLVGGSGGA